MNIVIYWLGVLFLYLISVFTLGIWIGKKSLACWEKPTSRWLCVLFFPLAAAERYDEEKGHLSKQNIKPSELSPLIEGVFSDWSSEQKRKDYIAATAYLWPLRLLANFVFIFVLLLMICTKGAQVFVANRVKLSDS